jgi:predicted branched-subunit amino acid permease
MDSRKKLFINGVKDGIPIALGYLSVSFAFGISAVKNGIEGLDAVLISATNLTSAGQVAGIEIIKAGGTLLEMLVTQLIINLRYMLMSLSLSQKTDESFTLLDRLVVSFGITDEIFGVASSKHRVYPPYMYGLILMPFLGWTLGTFGGAFVGEVLPEALKSSLGIAIYGMFIAIVVPETRENKFTLLAVLLAVVLSLLFYYLPYLNLIPRGFVIIIVAAISAAVFAFVAPIKEEEND